MDSTSTGKQDCPKPPKGGSSVSPATHSVVNSPKETETIVSFSNLTATKVMIACIFYNCIGKQEVQGVKVWTFITDALIMKLYSG